MVAASPRTRDALVKSLEGLGYRSELLARDYRFGDWFAENSPHRVATVATFARTPRSYDTACIGIVESNGTSRSNLINEFRALGAPVLLEIEGSCFREWMVSRDAGKHALVGQYDEGDIDRVFDERAEVWNPHQLYRAKNIGSFSWVPQFTLFSGLLPELEEHIQGQLEPLLRAALSQSSQAYQRETGRDPDPRKLFKLIFWLLTAKVFYDRGVRGFAKFSGETPDAERIIAAVAKQYGESVPTLLTQKCRAVAASHVWTTLDFKNISVDVLSQIWASALVDPSIKAELGVHRTPKPIVDFIVDRIGFDDNTNSSRLVLEPCSGSGSFLVGAMHALRDRLFGMSSADRHKYFTKTLLGIEKDPFGAEISRLALTLADFPNPNGWTILEEDVYKYSGLSELLNKSAVVLCNPPFRDFSSNERTPDLPSVKRPAALLNIVLDHLHPSGVLGFVLPRTFATGAGGYAEVRKRIAERFARIEVTTLPDKAFDASVETCLLVATNPVQHGARELTVNKVNDSAASWSRFERLREVDSSYTRHVSPEDFSYGVQMPDLAELWEYLEGNDTIGDVTEIHRGIEWNEPLTVSGEETGNRQRFEVDAPREGFTLGVPTRSKFDVYQLPQLKYLDVRPENQRGNAYTKADWSKPKAIVNKSARSRGQWRISAFPDRDGIVCYQTFIGIWPNSRQLDCNVLTAIINSPIANAFIVSWEGKTDVRLSTLKRIPVPYLDHTAAVEIGERVREYDRALQSSVQDRGSLYKRLAAIDAAVLDAYDLPPRLEHELLLYFSDSPRQTPFKFNGYVGYDEDEAYFTLSERLRSGFDQTTAKSFFASGAPD
ncbi:MAG: N-6 DNA methylase [Planctomycetota bacterium]